ncbi:MAG: hypothetical protein D6682_06180 [Zetaproteobacteria bacterium]|nr:MAG: hypothetical protein D6682_06180 [Zetaproteobacteria bacterium]
MAIADMFAANEAGKVRVLVKSDRECYILGADNIGQGFAYDREEIEAAAIIASVFEIEWVEEP